MTLLAVPICGKDLCEAGSMLSRARESGVDLVELRVDYLDQLSVEIVREYLSMADKNPFKILVTCRDIKEGGAKDWDIDLRTEVLVESVKCGADFIDCEILNFKGKVEKKLRSVLSTHADCRLILSRHSMEGPFKLDRLGRGIELMYDSILAVCPEAIPKLVFRANHVSDCFMAFDVLRDKDSEAIVLCMGDEGVISRVLAKKLDSFITYCSLDDNSATADGQISLDNMKGLFRWDSINKDTDIYGVIGDPVGHSLSPAIFNACFDKKGINAVYLPILTGGFKEGFDEFVNGAVKRANEGWLNFKGFSVTIPHKANALGFAGHEGDYLETPSTAIGAINTLKVGFGGIVQGFNTDYEGAMDALTAAMGCDRHGLHGKKAVVIGAGGVARAVIGGLVHYGSEVTIYNRTESKASSLAEELKCSYKRFNELDKLEADIVINCTSIGMYPNVESSVLDKDVISSDMVVFDTVYNPQETKLLRYAKEAGAKTISGVEMFIRQALAQYRIWLGEADDEVEDIMRKTVYEHLGGGD